MVERREKKTKKKNNHIGSTETRNELYFLQIPQSKVCSSVRPSCSARKVAEEGLRRRSYSRPVGQTKYTHYSYVLALRSME
jgi:hypothetical protein